MMTKTIIDFIVMRQNWQPAIWKQALIVVPRWLASTSDRISVAAKSGLSVQELTQKLSQVLPQAVDHLTPNGAIPKG